MGSLFFMFLFFRTFAFENINRILKLNKMDKKTKIILGAVVAVVVLVIGFLQADAGTCRDGQA